jgi:hypothetical protein
MSEHAIRPAPAHKKIKKNAAQPALNGILTSRG